jgi:uncharacterized protein
MCVTRTIDRFLADAATEFPALVVTGPRQSGKTTTLEHVFGKTHAYVSLDEPDVRLRAVDDPRLFVRDHPSSVIFDDIQHAPALSRPAAAFTV